VSPAMGAVSAVSAFVFAYFILGERLSGNFLAGFVLLVSGTALMSYFRFNKETTVNTVLSGVLLGLSLIFMKMIFAETSFLSGFFWSRMANFAGALMFLLVPSIRSDIKLNIKKSSNGIKWFIVVSKVLAGVAFLFVSLAVDLGKVSVVNALSGVQFVFLLLFALIFNSHLSKRGYMFETVDKKHIIGQKFLATLLIVGGLALLFV